MTLRTLTSRGGLIYEGDRDLSAPEADRIAQRNGYVFAERLAAAYAGRSFVVDDDGRIRRGLTPMEGPPAPARRVQPPGSPLDPAAVRTALEGLLDALAEQLGRRAGLEGLDRHGRVYGRPVLDHLTGDAGRAVRAAQALLERLKR